MIQFHLFLLLLLAFWCHLLKIVARTKVKNIFPMFPSRIFLASVLTFGFFNPF